MKSFFTLMALCALGVTTFILPVTAFPQESRKLEASNASICRELNLFNTGIDSNGLLLADGETDPHYVLTSVPSGSTSQTLVRRDGRGWPLSPNGPYIPDNGISSWIGPNNDAALNGPTGNYIYETTFNIIGNTATVIEGQWSSDNDGVEILLNNRRVGGATSFEQFRSFVQFRITSGFQQGVNTLKFVVHNGPPSPTALRVELECN